MRPAGPSADYCHSRVVANTLFAWLLSLQTTNTTLVVLGHAMIIVFTISSTGREFKPGRGRWIFKDDKNPEHDFIRRVSKAVDPAS
jgi:hypothetical protein